MRPPPPSRVIADLAGCLRFFSRLPVPALSTADDPAALPEMRRAAALVPAAGLVIALPAAVVAALAVAAGLPDLVAGALAVAASAATTGALHEDGLADSADGLYGGASRERRLEIMRDSRIGSYGALALALVALVRAAAVAALVPAGPAGVAAAVIAAAGVGRAGMVGLWWALPPARADGLSASVGRPGMAAAATAAATGLALAMAALASAGPGPVALGVAAAGLAVAAVGRIARDRIGGQTGDVLGAAELLGETAFLAALSIGAGG